ncbi:hypothetical protein DFH08DRAFT_967459 [Mycena albidolilacea]|uniref:Uncharacterized protein n=1 Tax=Mycena albidolilacea TaxID=1033008 RepID=A0AAD7EIF6_9AGAR|nr:hypothetical protein DFH08DRAFT_967459 [Mycena albidolilacea]
MRIIYPERGAQDFAVARWLIQTAKVPVNAPDLSGTLAISHVISTKPGLDTEYGQLLFDAGGDLNNQNRYGGGPHFFVFSFSLFTHLDWPHLVMLTAWLQAAWAWAWGDRSPSPGLKPRLGGGNRQSLEKLDDYQKTSNSNAYMFAMVLDPTQKLSYFRAHWPAELQESAIENMEETFKQRYLKLHGASSAAPVPVKKVPTAKLRCSVVREDDETTNGTKTHINPLKP